MTKFGIGIPDYVVIYKGYLYYYIYYNDPPAYVLYSTMSSYDYVYLLLWSYVFYDYAYFRFTYPVSVYFILNYFSTNFYFDYF